MKESINAEHEIRKCRSGTFRVIATSIVFVWLFILFTGLSTFHASRFCFPVVWWRCWWRTLRGGGGLPPGKVVSEIRLRIKARGCASPTAYNIATWKAVVMSTNRLKRGNKGPFCSPNSFNNDCDNTSCLKLCWSWDSPKSLYAKWSFEVEIVPLLSFCDETRAMTPIFIAAFYSLWLQEQYI